MGNEEMGKWNGNAQVQVSYSRIGVHLVGSGHETRVH